MLELQTLKRFGKLIDWDSITFALCITHGFLSMCLRPSENLNQLLDLSRDAVNLGIPRLGLQPYLLDPVIVGFNLRAQVPVGYEESLGLSIGVIEFSVEIIVDHLRYCHAIARKALCGSSAGTSWSDWHLGYR